MNEPRPFPDPVDPTLTIEDAISKLKVCLEMMDQDWFLLKNRPEIEFKRAAIDKFLRLIIPQVDPVAAISMLLIEIKYILDQCPQLKK